MVTAQDIEGFLIKMGVSYEELRPKTWMVHDDEENLDNLVVTLNEPVVLFHVKLFDIPDHCDRMALYEALLRLNATDMVHGAYGLEGTSVVATDTLQAENLDFNEFQASVDALALCIATHYKKLLPYLEKKAS